MFTVEQQVKRFNDHGYRCIHLIRNLYLVRKYSVNYCKFSLYHLRILRNKF